SAPTHVRPGLRHCRTARFDIGLPRRGGLLDRQYPGARRCPVHPGSITLLRECLGTDFTVDEVRSVADWTGSLSVATSYRLGSIFLAGDSAHQFFPAGGHGANTGIADAVNLGWKLAAVVQGWGGEGLLDSYDAERRPVALFNREMCT